MKTILSGLLILACVPAYAQSAPQNAASVFASNPGYQSTSASGSYWEGGYGIGFEHMFTPRVSAFASIARETYYGAPAGPGLRRIRYATQPIDVAIRYHVANTGHWRPYLGIGYHYVASAGDNHLVLAHPRSAELNAGVVFQPWRSVGLFLDAKRLLNTSTTERYDPRTKIALGLRWQF